MEPCKTAGCRYPDARARNRAPQAAPHGDNGSAFFFRLPSRAKSAMAEILVSDLCECRPPLLIGGLIVAAGGPTCVRFLFPLFFALFFRSVSIVLASAVFFLGLSKPCIANAVAFPL